MLCDSDAFILFGASGLIREVGEVFGVGLENIRRLHALPFMLDKGKLERKYPPGIREKVKSWCAVIDPIIEAPSEATRQRLLGVEGIHDGESELFGLLVENPDYLLLSGDKVAMRSLSNGPGLGDIFQHLRGRVACTEIALLGLLRILGIKVLATSLAPLRPYSVILNTVLSMGANSTHEECRAGLSSYHRDLIRDLGPDFLLKLNED